MAPGIVNFYWLFRCAILRISMLQGTKIVHFGNHLALLMYALFQQAMTISTKYYESRQYL